MNRIIKYYGFGALLIGAISCSLFSCKDESLKASLGPLPKADFSIVKGKDANSIILVNKTNMPSIAYWASSNGLDAKGDSATLHFTFEGTYTVKLIADGHGGIDSVSKEITIDQNDPSACQGTVQGFIAGCSARTWKLNPDAGAEGVGPEAGSLLWWSNTAADVNGDRICDFNDEWTFQFDATGDMQYDNKGDFFSEDYLGKANNSCGVDADLSSTQKPWASGDFHYQIIPNAGTNPEYGQLKVIGTGAHIGFPRVTNGADNKTAPVRSITYDIVGMEHKEGYDLLTLSINEGTSDAATWWTFTLRSNN